MSKFKKLTVTIFTMFILGIVLSTTSNAKDWGTNPGDSSFKAENIEYGDEVKLGYWWAGAHKDIFCIWAGQHFDQSKERDYKAASKITIIGNTSTDHTGKSIENRIGNGKFAYILSTNSGKGSLGYAGGNVDQVQRRIWHYTGTWVKYIGKDHAGLYEGIANKPVWRGTAAMVEADKKAEAEAEEYAKSLKENKIEDKTNKDNITVKTYKKDNETYFKVGPFSVEFAGKLSKLEVSDKNGKKYTPTTFGQYSGKTFVEKKLNEINTGTNFYIIIPLNTGLTGINKIKIENNYTVIKAVMIFWKHPQNWKKREGGFVVNWQNLIQFTTTDEPQYAEIEIKDIDVQFLINISGYVWEDKGKIVKGSTLYNDIYDNNEESKVAGIGVRLVDKNGNIIKNINGDECKKTTNNKGEYIFTDLLITDLQKYMVEFEYNGLTHTSVKYLQGNDNKINSKAGEVEKQRKDLNAGFAEITNAGDTSKRDQGYSRNKNGDVTGNITYTNNTENYESKFKSATYDSKTYSGTNLTANTNVTGFSLYEQYLNGNIEPSSVNDNEEIKNVNLGIVERAMPKMGLYSDIVKVFVNVNGYEHEYLYNQRENQITEAAKNSNFNLGVKFKNELNQRYWRAIYPSDVKQNNTTDKKLKVYVQYCTTISNLSETLSASANEFVTYYDKNYKLINNNTQGVDDSYKPYYTDVNGNKKGTIEWKENSKYQQANNGQTGGKFNTIYTTSLANNKIENYGILRVYYTFEVEEEAIKGLLNNTPTLDCVSEIFSYSTYYGTAKRGSESGAAGEAYAGIDQFSAPGNAKAEINTNNEIVKTTFEQDTDNAPSLLLEAKGARDIEGTVFEDNTGTAEVKSESERNGDGLYKKGEENTVSNVKVELLRAEDGSVAKIYPPEDSQANNEANTITTAKDGIDAVTTTNASGYYKFRGVEPDKYLIRYTYGDGTTKLCDTHGNVIKDSKNPNEDFIVKVQDYKSTLIKSDIIRKAFEDNNNNLDWYKKETTEDKRYSDARDDYSMREAIDNELTTITTNTTTTKNTLNANTPNFEIGVEYDSIVTAAMTGEDIFYVLINNVDFGIARRPKQLATLEKDIKFIKYTLGDGNIYTSGNVDIKNGVLPDKTYVAGNKLYLQIDTELIQDSHLELEYNLIFKNASELDYRSEKYYYYGEKDPDNIIKHTGTALMDYIDSEVVLHSGQSEVEDGKWKVMNLTDGSYSEELGLIAERKDIDSTFDRNTIIQKLKTQYNSLVETDKLEFGNGLIPGGTTSIDIAVEKLITAKEDELVFDNNAEILKLVKTGGSYAETNYGSYAGLLAQNVDAEPEELDEDEAPELVIIPPTGLTNNNITYAIIAIISLAVLGAGTYGVRKFLKK